MNRLWQSVRLYFRDLWFRPQVKSVQRRERGSEVHAAIERVVDQVNPRIRALPGYRRKLFDAVAHSLDYCAELSRQVPGPVLLNRQTWASDPLVNALFGNADRLRWALSSPEVRAYIKETALETEDCFAVLAAMPLARSQLGVELVGDAVQRDVQRTTVSFANHEVGLVAADPETVRERIKQAAMDILAGIAVGDIAAHEERIAQLEERLRIVRIKQRALSPSTRGMDFLGKGSEPQLAEYQAHGQRIQELEKDLADARIGLATLDDYLTRLRALLQHPERHMGVRLERVRLDRMNVVHTGAETDLGDTSEIELLRGYRDDRRGRVLLLVRFQRAEIVPESERLAEVERYVNA